MKVTERGRQAMDKSSQARRGPGQKNVQSSRRPASRGACSGDMKALKGPGKIQGLC